MRESVSYSKLKDGTWGVRFATQGRHPAVGDSVIVSKANGETRRETLGALVTQDRGAFPGPANYYRIARPSARPARIVAQQREQIVSAAVSATRTDDEALTMLRDLYRSVNDEATREHNVAVANALKTA